VVSTKFAVFSFTFKLSITQLMVTGRVAADEDVEKAVIMAEIA
jgi:hypothetical protein